MRLRATLRRRGVILCALVLSAFTLVPGPARAEQWRVGSMEHFVPFNFLLEDGRYGGLDTEILDAVFARIGVTPHHAPRAWKRAVAEFERGDTDMLFQLSPKPERFKDYLMIGPIRWTKTVFAVPRTSAVEDVTDLSDLSGRTVAVVQEFFYSQDFQDERGFTRVVVYNDTEALRLLSRARVEFAVGGQATLSYLAREIGVQDQIRFLPTPLVVNPRYVAFPRTEDGATNAIAFDRALEDLRADGTLDRILTRWRD